MKLKKIASLVMAGAMLLSMGGMTAFATATTENALNEDTTTSSNNTNRVQGDATGGSESPAELAITKNLFMAPNVLTPTKTFKFTVTPVSVDGVDYVAASEGPTATLANMPTISPVEIEISGADATSYSTDGVTFSGESSALDTMKVVTDTSDDILLNVVWPHAGVYLYTIEETKPSAENPAGTNDPEISYSTAKYEIHIYVANRYTDNNKDTYNPTVPDPLQLYVAAVGVYVKANEFDSTLTVGTKVNANGGGLNGNGSQFAFKNIYTPLSDLRVEKKLVGAYADRTKKFEFKLTFTLPAASVAKRETSYKAYICNADGSIVGTPITFTDDGMGTGTFKTDADIQLSDGQYLQFGYYDTTTQNFTTDGVLPTGTTYELSETLATDYAPSVKVYYADGTTAKTKDANAEIDGNSGEVSTTNNNSKLIVGDASNNKELLDNFLANNHAIVTNTYKPITPTGILIDNLPAILLIAVAVGGAVLYIISKKRRSER